ncbi:MAG: YggS family pyridoxal phosphate-dependent enzyme, partial [Planctomycetales bacterium]|nr:YggS family pyridoxal phosphate-dependent enzyme [Planctomycetales bacterium]
MTDPRQTIADNVKRVRDEIAAAAVAAGRDPASVRLVAVSKYVDVAQTACLLAAGCRELGESRPQQLWSKAADPLLVDARWHMVGHLQRNKVRRTLANDPLIHSVDSERLLRTLQAEAASLGTMARVLLEVNCSGETAKHGLEPADVAPLLALLGELPHVQIGGLMTMAAGDGSLATAGRNFAALRELRDQLQPACPPGADLAELSMGMSGD